MTKSLHPYTTKSGRAPALSFFQDKTGHEVDFVVETGGKLTPIEAKCTRTFRREHLAGIRLFKELFGRRVAKPLLLHAGDEDATVEGVRLENAVRHFGGG